MKRTLQPRYAATWEPACVGCRCRACADWVKARANGEATVICSRWVYRGTEGGTKGKTRGLNWGSSRTQSIRGRRAKTRRTKKIRRWEGVRVSDEAIVSEDPAGQHNPQASQGPLDWIAEVRRNRHRRTNAPPLRGAKGPETSALAVYKLP
jgi:hypothetical protein